MILVTGGTGFIGSHLVEELLKRKEQVRCLVRPDKKKDFLQTLPIEFIYGDITDEEALKKAIEGVKVIYNLAGINAKKGIPDEQYWNVHVYSTEKLMSLALKNKVEKFVHCSSVAVLGTPKLLPATEKSPYNPQTIYEKTKMEGEKVALGYIKKGLPVTIIRPALNYGPRDFSGVYRLIKMITEQKFKFIGDGKNKWHMVYVTDCVQGFILAGEKKEAIGEIFIIGGERPLELQELVGLICKELKIAIPKSHLPLWMVKSAGFVGDILIDFLKIKNFPITSEGVDFLTYTRYYNISKAKKLLGYNPTIAIKEGINKTIVWYKKNNYL